MPSFGVYPVADALTAGDEISSTYEGRHITLTAAELLTSAGSGVAVKGLPCVFGLTGLQGVGICLNSGTTTDLIAIDTEGIWVVDVHAADDGGNVAVAGGDRLYINTTTGVVSKIASAATQVPFGYALGIVASSLTETIAVKVHWDPVDNMLLDDEPLIFGDDADIVFTFTEEELAITGDRTTGGDGDYYRQIHVANTVGLGAVDRWGSISAYTTLTGGAGGATWAAAIVGTLEQATKQVDGYIAAGIFEMKNDADNCSTCSVINLVMDNDSNVGFGGVMHSYIRCDATPSAGTIVTNLFNLHGHDATAAANANALVCQCGNANAVSHSLKIIANGVPYWIMMDSTPPA